MPKQSRFCQCRSRRDATDADAEEMLPIPKAVNALTDASYQCQSSPDAANAEAGIDADNADAEDMMPMPKAVNAFADTILSMPKQS